VLGLSLAGPCHAQTASVMTFGAPFEQRTAPAALDAADPVDAVAQFNARTIATSQIVGATGLANRSPPQGCDGRSEAPPRLLRRSILLARRTWWPAITAAECRHNLPAGLMDSVVLAESSYDTRAVSPAGAAGLTQLSPATALEMGVLDRFDPLANVEGGARYLRTLLDSFGGDVPLALAAYNAGPGAVRRVRGIPLNGETPAYVSRVLSLWTAPAASLAPVTATARQLAVSLGFTPRVGR
jgi:soluble lytic murein transglycosylase-like protein